jgi:hypothetical protein
VSWRDPTICWTSTLGGANPPMTHPDHRRRTHRQRCRRPKSLNAIVGCNESRTRCLIDDHRWDRRPTRLRARRLPPQKTIAWLPYRMMPSSQCHRTAREAPHPANGFPVNFLNPVKAVPEVCTIHCRPARPAARHRLQALTTAAGQSASHSVAEGGRGLITDPLPQRYGPLDFGTGDERIRIKLLGVEANRTDVVVTTGGLVALLQIG